MTHAEQVVEEIMEEGAAAADNHSFRRTLFLDTSFLLLLPYLSLSCSKSITKVSTSLFTRFIRPKDFTSYECFDNDVNDDDNETMTKMKMKSVP